MREALVIAKREFLERVRTKWFVVITLLGPILMIGLILIPALLGGGSEGAKVDIVDQTGKVGAPLAAALRADDQHWKATVIDPGATDEQELARVRTKAINGFIRIPVDGLAQGQIIYRGDNATNQSVGFTLQKSITGVIYAERGAEHGLTPPQLAQMLAPPSIHALHTTGATAGESGGGTFLIGYIIAFILYMVITLYGVNVLRSIVTEKSTRVVELMVAATKPRAMMTGKILGVGGVGLAQVAVWFLVGGVALAYRVQLLHAFGAGNAGSALPPLTPMEWLVIIVFFIFGYLFYSTMYAAIGATVSSEQDSQQAAVPITMLLMIGFVSMTAVTGDPRGSTSALLTLVPTWSPMLMPLRYLLGGATPAEVALSLGILVVTTILIARAAAKIYRVGILMYGKRPGLGELVRWLRY